MSGTILLADDSLTIQKVVELTFADTDNSVVTVSSGDELLERLPAVAPDLVICDVIMPGTDGYSVCQAIKSNPATLHIPVVLLTGTFEPFDRDRALAAGCDEIITKPFEARKLVDTVESLLQGTPETVPETAPIEPTEGEPQFEGAFTPTEPEAVPPTDEFGTRLAPAAPPSGGEPGEASEGMDFTTTGFAEMEEAGQRGEEMAYQTPSEGLEFDLEEVKQPLEPEAAERSAPPPFSAEDEPAGSDETAEPFSPAADTASAVTAPPPPPPFGEPDEPFEEAPPAVEEAEEQEPPIGSVTEPVAVPPVGTFETPAFGQAGGDEEEVAEEAAAAAVPEPTEAEPVTQTADAEPPAPAEPLSEDEVERIARRVIDLFASRLEQIAWEVIPDMAEIVVRERVRQIEAEAESDQPEATH
ncbi:MAG: response regulator [Acidobacteria bacterium]|nr:response regulator [Acidobacteriota bacterium]